MIVNRQIVSDAKGIRKKETFPQFIPVFCPTAANDQKFGQQFAQIEVIKTPIQAPKANAICERFISSVQREYLNHILILNERHLKKQLNEYNLYFNHARPHQGIGKIPDARDPDNFQSLSDVGTIIQFLFFPACIMITDGLPE